MMGFKPRPIEDDDPLVCGCGVTLGTQKLAKDPHRLEAVKEAHAPEHVSRMRHQNYHHGPADDCTECPRLCNCIGPSHSESCPLKPEEPPL